MDSSDDQFGGVSEVQTRAASSVMEAGMRKGPVLDPALVDSLVDGALAEDCGSGDVTTAGTVDPKTQAVGKLLAREFGVVAGLGIFGRVFDRVAPGGSGIQIEFTVADGDRVAPGQVLARLAGPAALLLIGERTALNFAQRLSGIATMTAQFVERALGNARILDTRKTTPGLRALEKYAVRCGGGENHRFGLFDQAMIKDNHLDLAGMELGVLIKTLHAAKPELFITAEARDEAEASAAARAGANLILLDNMTPTEIERLCPILRELAGQRSEGQSTVEIEASGGINLENIAEYAHTGVDRISIGALTHSAPSLDLSLALEPAK